MVTMKIASIKTNSMAEVEGYIADVIWFQGCPFRCPYCFNPELQPLDNGKEMDVDTVVGMLSDISDVVVLSGGEPALQYSEGVGNLITRLKEMDKKIILETSVYNQDMILKSDKVYGSIFCYEPLDNYGILGALDYYENVELLAVVGNPEFRLDVFEDLLANTEKDVWIKFYNGLKPDNIEEIIKVLKKHNKPVKVLVKLEL
jgi:uncharacterized Fe-S cluster-containing radical SAM superfamily protein